MSRCVLLAITLHYCQILAVIQLVTPVTLFIFTKKILEPTTANPTALLRPVAIKVLEANTTEADKLHLRP